MSIYGKCEKCGNELVNYMCAYCLQEKVNQFEEEKKLAINEEMERCISIVKSKESWITKKWADIIVSDIRLR